MTDTVAPSTLQPTGAASIERVLWVRHWNEHLFSFAVTRPASFRFRSGEFVMIGLAGDNGKPLLRAYSIASPSYSEELEFLSIKVEDGPLTSRCRRSRSATRSISAASRPARWSPMRCCPGGGCS
jgi:ferredoxin--NADP+ reductase